MSKIEFRLRFLLVSLGIICMLAVIPLILPVRTIDSGHRAMGLGAFPTTPIAEYLVRSVCSLCTFYGGLLLVLTRDVRRFAPVIGYQALAIMILSAYGIVAGVRAGLPAVWVITDAIGCWIFLLPIYFLSRRVAVSEPGVPGLNRGNMPDWKR